MKNKEALIMAINEEFDDWAASESWIYYHINCPYCSGDKRSHCHGDVKKVNYDNCCNCKREWLDGEVEE